MGKTVEALFDGTVLRPTEPLTLEPNTRVWIVIETVPPPTAARSFLRTARSLNLEGPSDWSANLEQYLYGSATQHAGQVFLVRVHSKEAKMRDPPPCHA